MTTYFGISGKFASTAQKAFFNELSLQLEMSVEDLNLETKQEVFDELIAIVEALKLQSISHQADKIVAEYAAKRAATKPSEVNEVKF